jgi:multiple sugar transport system permease protein
MSFKSTLRAIKRETNWVRIIIFIIFSIYALSMVYAIFWTLMNSLKGPVEYILGPNKWPEKLLFHNYVEAFKLLKVDDIGFFGMFFNSIWITCARSFTSTACLACAGYVFSKCKFYGKNIIFNVLIFTMMLPLYGSSASYMKLIHALDLYDCPFYPIVASISMQGMMMLVVRTYFNGISNEYAEAAKMDGAGYYTIFFRIMLPLALPCLSSILILMLIEGWNDYMMPLMYMPSYLTVPTGLHIYSERAKFNLNYPIYFAGIILTCIPSILLYVFTQNRILNNVAMGGIKG